MERIDQLGETNVDEVPEGSRFLLKMDYDNLMKSNIHNKTYWVVAMEAAINSYPVNWSVEKAKKVKKETPVIPWGSRL